jgi:ParB-like chromosome segregation protein Spo0J
MKLQVEYVPISTIKPYEHNAKLHPQEQIEQIKNSMQEFGNIDPIGVWHDEIVEGHGRYEALKQMGVKEIPIIRLDDLTDEQRRAYSLTHNKLTMNSDFDLALLDTELAEIETIDMTLLGFGDDKQEGAEDQPAEPSRETSFNYKEQYGVIVMCKDEQEQEAVYNRLAEEGYECKVVAV